MIDRVETNVLRDSGKKKKKKKKDTSSERETQRAEFPRAEVESARQRATKSRYQRAISRRVALFLAHVRRGRGREACNVT